MIKNKLKNISLRSKKNINLDEAQFSMEDLRPKHKNGECSLTQSALACFSCWPCLAASNGCTCCLGLSTCATSTCCAGCIGTNTALGSLVVGSVYGLVTLIADIFG